MDGLAMIIKEKQYIYVAVAATIQVPVIPDSYTLPHRTVIQPAGRQIAQACHVTSLLRQQMTEVMGLKETFEPRTTIILQARDSAELRHILSLLTTKKLRPVSFADDNPEYGPGNWRTAVAVLASKSQIKNILDYLPLWGSK